MTCIVGLVQDGRVYIGGDSAGVDSDSWDLRLRTDAKVFRNNGYLFGFTSSFRMGQLVRWAFEPPAYDPSVDLDRYMATTFVDAVRQCFRKGGYARVENEVERGGTFVVGYQGRLFVVYDNYQVACYRDNYVAVGCGDQVALGCLYATEGTGMPPRKRVLLALEASEQYSAGVRGPFVVVSSEEK